MPNVLLAGAGPGVERAARLTEELALHLEGRCSHEPWPIVVPKLLDVADGVATFDARQAHKQPDWTYVGEPDFCRPRAIW